MRKPFLRRESDSSFFSHLVALHVPHLDGSAGAGLKLEPVKAKKEPIKTYNSHWKKQLF